MEYLNFFSGTKVREEENAEELEIAKFENS